VLKISRPIIYTAVLGVAAYAAVVITEPEAAPKRPTTPTKRAASSLPNGLTEADMKARFARYNAPARDAFKPLVVASKSSVNAANRQSQSLLGVDGAWALTGINEVNGTPIAVIENASTRDSQFLQVGDTWKGLRVQSVSSDGLVFVNAQGQQTRLGFVAPAPLNVMPISPGRLVTEPTPAAPGTLVTDAAPPSAREGSARQ
jgi:hypothetical protein